MFHHGSISRIYLKNFMTFDDFELIPGPRFNLVLGPNGTGKSSILNGIILGLGGKPQVIGKSPHIGSYVQHGFERATIELELVNNKGINFIIRRSFKTCGTSTWNLNGSTVPLREIESIVKKFNIQVDNLCQFLPQDRVQDFAKMDPKQLLHNTQRSIGDPELADNFQQLIQISDNVKELNKVVLQEIKTVEEFQEKIDKLEKDVEKFKERRRLIHQLNVMKQKVLWLNYFDKVNHSKMVIEGARKLSKTCILYRKMVEPLKEESNSLIAINKKITSKLSHKNIRVTRIKHSFEYHESEQFRLQEKIRDVHENYKRQLFDRENKKLLLKKTIQEIEEIQTLFSRCSDEELSKECLLFDKRIEELNLKYSEAKKEEFNLNDNNISLMHELKAIEHKILQAESFSKKKFDIMRQMPDLYNAYNWLKEHKDMFNGQIYGPMFLFLNIKHPDYAQYVEQSIPSKDMIAFVFEKAEEMTLFLNEVREKLHLSVNAISSAAPLGPISEIYKATYQISDLEKYSFKYFVTDLVEGPDIIIKYLCELLHIHEIPVGTDETLKIMDHIPSNIWKFYAGSKTVRRNVSEYSHNTITIISEINDPHFVTCSTDLQIVNELKEKFKNVELQIQNKKCDIDKIKQSMKEIELELNRARSKKREVVLRIESRNGNRVRLRLKEEQKQSLESSFVDEKEEKNNMKIAIKELIKSRIQNEIKFFNNLKSMVTMNNSIINLRKTLNKIISITESHDPILQNMEKELRGSKFKLEKLKAEIASARNAEKEAFKKAELATNKLLPQNPQFKRKLLPSFKKLPKQICELEEKINHTEARARCLECPEEQFVMDLYEKTKRSAEAKQKELEKNKYSLEVLTREKDRYKELWLPKLTSLVNVISTKFSKFFSAMGCAGTIEIDKGKNEDDFEQYGLLIKVKFRDEGVLQKLDFRTQSGGEKTLSTAVYMLSLQAITSVPLRCVDEINQGMDEANERRVYNLLTNTIAESDTAQYFLLSPKLLSNLNHSPHTTAIIIFNSPSAVSHREWSLQRYINSLPDLSDSDSD